MSQRIEDVLGPTPTRYTTAGEAPYVARPKVDAALRTALASGGPPYPFVVLVYRAGDITATAKAALRRAIQVDVAFIPDPNELAEARRLYPEEELAKRRDIGGARAAYQLAIDSGHDHAAPLAAVSLGLLLVQQGDMDDARRAYQLAIDSGHADAAPLAAVSVGFHLGRAGGHPGRPGGLPVRDRLRPRKIRQARPPAAGGTQPAVRVATAGSP